MFQERMYRAVLDEFVPEWEAAIQQLTPNEFAELWQDRTSQNRSSGYRWYHRAIAIAGERQAAA